MQRAAVVQSVAMKAVIAHEGKLLLLKESGQHDTNVQSGKYGFPGGRVEPGEAVYDGLRREVLEETGMSVTIGEPLYIGEWFPVIKNVPHHIVAMFVICNPTGTEVRLSEEHDGYLWVELKDLPKLRLMTPDDTVAEMYFMKLAPR